MHRISEPAILYFGTPVVLIGTVNENGTYNLAPISSAFWLGWRCIIGIGSSSKTTENLIRTKQCVLNLPSVNEVRAVDRLALTTGSNPVPETKKRRGYEFEQEKFERANFTSLRADIVDAPRAMECPVQMESTVIAINPLFTDDPSQQGRIVTIELKILRVYIEDSLLMDDQPNRVDPDKWKPLIMSFQQFYGLTDRVYPSTLAKVPERLYAK